MKPQDKENLGRAFRELAKKNSFLELVYLHGSYATGNSTPLSDVDIALVINTKHFGKNRWDFEIEIEDLLEGSFPTFEFDVRIINDAPLDFQGKVITDGKLLYAISDTIRANYEERTRKHYFDFKFFIDNYCSERLRTIREQGLTHG